MNSLHRTPPETSLELAPELALAYAAIGWPVFPCEPGGKWPLIRSPHPKGSPERSGCLGRWGGCGRDGHGVKDASTDPAVIREWWAREPQANIGLACGLTRCGHGPDVVDFDVKDGANGGRSFQLLKEEGFLRGAFAMVATPSGGWHLYYEGSAQGNGRLPGCGVDFRAAGGYVLGVGSATAKGVYRWLLVDGLPSATVDWAAIRDRLKPPPPARPARSLRNHDVTMRGLRDFVHEQTGRSGNRNEGLFWAVMKALEDGHDDGALELLADEARANGLPDHEVRKAVRSARDRFAVRSTV